MAGADLVDKQKGLKVINIILGVIILGIGSSVLVRNFFHYEVFAKLHLIVGILFILTLLVHLTLNWTWIKATYLKKQKEYFGKYYIG